MDLSIYKNYSVNYENGMYVVESNAKSASRCPVCHSRYTRIIGKYIRHAYDIDGQMSVSIGIQVHRYICAACKKTFTESYDFIEPYCHLTERMRKAILRDREKMENCSFDKLSVKYGISKNIVRRACACIDQQKGVKQ